MSYKKFSDLVAKVMNENSSGDLLNSENIFLLGKAELINNCAKKSSFALTDYDLACINTRLSCMADLGLPDSCLIFGIARAKIVGVTEGHPREEVFIPVKDCIVVDPKNLCVYDELNYSRHYYRGYNAAIDEYPIKEELPQATQNLYKAKTKEDAQAFPRYEEFKNDMSKMLKIALQNNRRLMKLIKDRDLKWMNHHVGMIAELPDALRSLHMEKEDYKQYKQRKEDLKDKTSVEYLQSEEGDNEAGIKRGVIWYGRRGQRINGGKFEQKVDKTGNVVAARYIKGRRNERFSRGR